MNRPVRIPREILSATPTTNEPNLLVFISAMLSVVVDLAEIPFAVFAIGA
jgi:hypothetical protein